MDVEGCPLPEDRRYDLEHDVWLKADPDTGLYELGLLKSLSAFAGRITALTYRPVSGPLARGRSVATVESVRYTGAVRLPVEAEVRERNLALPLHPKRLNDDPYGTGWVARVRVVDIEEVPRWTREAEEVREALAARIRELRIRCYAAFPDAELYEVGAECAAVLARVDEALAQISPTEVLLLVTDDPTSPIELVRWSDRTGHTILGHDREGSLHRFLLRREADPRPRLRPRR